MSASEEHHSEFNPYRVWLGIPANKLPADHYSLLGLETYESDPEVISSAADKVMSFVKTFQTGKYSQQSQQLLNEISAARVCLLNEKSKAEYDAQLRAKEQAGASNIGAVAPPPPVGGGVVPPPQASVVPPVQAPAFNLDAGANNSPGDKRRQQKKKSGHSSKKGVVPFWIWGAGLAALAALALLFFFGLSKNNSPTDTELSENDLGLSDDSDFSAINEADKFAGSDVAAQSGASNNDNNGVNGANKVGSADSSGQAGAENLNGNQDSQNQTDVNNAGDTQADVSASNGDVDNDAVADEDNSHDDGENDFELPEATADTSNDLEPTYKTEEERLAAAKAAKAERRDARKAAAAAIKNVPAKRIEHTVKGVPFPTPTKAGDRHVITIDDVDYAFRWAPAGSFTMGSPASEPGRNVNETQHSEKISAGFWILETEVTHAMYDVIMGSPAPSASVENRPVSNATWDQARVYCDKLSRIANLDFSLPTEVQWEYACRAGSQTAYNFGAASADLHKNGNYCDQSHAVPSEPEKVSLRDANHNDNFARSAPVKSFQPNAWGLYDMHGNVYEWCLYPHSQPIDETPNPSKHVRRGGGFHSSLSQCRSAARNASNSDDQSGFRIVYRGGAAPVAPTNVHRKITEDKTPIDGDIRKPGKKPGQRAEIKIANVPLVFRWCPPGTTRVYRSSKKDVAISQGFWILETEVTQQMYEKVTGKNPSQFKGDNNPVEQVDWMDAQLFCKKLSQQLPAPFGKVEFYLPTESQWVYAGRAGKLDNYSTGETIPVNAANCNAELPCEGVARGKYIGSTMPVGSYPPNAWGLYDMQGNVGEWCFDLHDAAFRSNRSEGLIADPIGASTGTNRIIRGGNWFSPYSSSSFQTGFICWPPETSSPRVGFRICTFPTGVALGSKKQADGNITGLFDNQPDAVDLPEKNSDKEITLMTIPYSEKPWELSALGLKQLDASFAFEQTNKSLTQPEWKYSFKGLEIARIRRDGSNLLFKFTDFSGLDAVQLIRNTILKIAIGDDSHYLALRKPYLITDNEFNCFTGRKTFSSNLNYLPKDTQILQTIGVLEAPPSAYVSSFVPETLVKPGKIFFTIENKPVADIRFDFNTNNGLKADVTLNGDKVFKTHLNVYLNDKTTATTAFTNATNRIAAIKRQAPTERNVKKRNIMLQDAVKAQYILWAHNFAKNAATTTPRLHFEVYVDCEGHRLTLMAIDPDMTIPPAN